MPLAEQPTPEAKKAAIALRIEMLEAETSNVLPGTEDGEELIAHRHRWLIGKALDRFAKQRNAATLQQHERAISDRDDLQRTFDLQWEADQRAIKRWQEAHPGNDLVWPDRANMVVWLMDQLDAAIATFDDEEAGHQDTLRLWLEAKAKRERAMAALREIADALEFVCDGVTASYCYAYATKQIAEETLMAALDDAASTAGDAVTTEEER